MYTTGVMTPVAEAGLPAKREYAHLDEAGFPATRVQRVNHDKMHEIIALGAGCKVNFFYYF
jgi:hypothetical protein